MSEEFNRDVVVVIYDQSINAVQLQHVSNLTTVIVNSSGKTTVDYLVSYLKFVLSLYGPMPENVSQRMHRPWWIQKGLTGQLLRYAIIIILQNIKLRPPYFLLLRLIRRL
jgi:hypothetical protein